MKKMKNYVFISYSTKNQQSADEVRMLLEKSNISSWMAPYDIPAGSKYAYEINDAIEGCACMLLLLTEESQKSEFVEKEVDRAITYKKMIIPLQLGDISLNSGFKYYLGNSQIIVLTKIDENSEEWIKTKEAIKSVTSDFEKDIIDNEKIISESKTGKLDNEITWKIDSNGDLHIDGKGELTCATIYGQTVDNVTVDSHLKEIRQNVIRVFVGEGIESIGEFSFYGFPELREVYLACTVRKIDTGAFKSCSKLSCIKLPWQLEEIGLSAFEDCYCLEEFELPDSVNIGCKAFKNCYSLLKLDKQGGKSITIFENAFENCRNLSQVSLDNVKMIGTYAFKNCPITYVNLIFQKERLKRNQTLQRCAFAMSGVREIHLRFPNLFKSTALSYDIDDQCFENCVNLTDVFFEEAIPYISNAAFAEEQKICIHVKEEVYNNVFINNILKSKWKIECLK